MKTILSQRLRQAAEEHRAGGGGGGVDVKLSLQDLVRLHGESSLAVLLMLLAGCTNKTISRELFISDETTRDHVSAILKFFGVQSRTQAVLAASRLGYTASSSSPPS